LKDLKRELEFHSADQNGVMAVDETFHQNANNPWRCWTAQNKVKLFESQ